MTIKIEGKLKDMFHPNGCYFEVDGWDLHRLFEEHIGDNIKIIITEEGE